MLPPEHISPIENSFTCESHLNWPCPFHRRSILPAPTLLLESYNCCKEQQLSSHPDSGLSNQLLPRIFLEIIFVCYQFTTLSLHSAPDTTPLFASRSPRKTLHIFFHFDLEIQTIFATIFTKKNILFHSHLKKTCSLD